MSLKDIATGCTQDPFIRLLVHLSQTISKSADQIYGQRHESLLHMWKVARSIAEDLRSHETRLEQTLGFGLCTAIQTGSLGVRQTIFTTLYYHTLLLTFRPFLIFRGRWQRDMKMSQHQSTDSGTNRPTETPSWLNEACTHALTAAQRTIHHLCEASHVNDLVRQERYHGYFMGSACFTLIYNFLHDPNSASVHLPWVYAALQNLSTMRAGDPIASTISAIQTVLRTINPSYAWIPYPKHGSRHEVNPSVFSTRAQESTTGHGQHSTMTGLASPYHLSGSHPDLSSFQSTLPQVEGPDTVGSIGSGEELLDFTQSDMGWDFDFSTMDLEAFFSIYQSMGAPIP
ncbi:hypothetical protein N7510_002765 [Penicillium lagena]|uniref:uncharacterized protein n=1 Tax=Penicillium lagena TaxID=94218 RepID=UPI0025410F28|nr:uncharacterized protein N7510_002765 [Penicillium lagena]KAJ5618781.1 hypothetical protein N7510_002765 [Penicillium lagena]